MRKILLMILLFFFPAAQAGKNDLSTLDERVGEILKQKDDGFYLSVFTQAYHEIMLECIDSKEDSLLSLLEIGQKLMLYSKRGRLEIRVVECPQGEGTLLNISSTVFVFSDWLKKASEEEKWAFLAHEISHRTDDFFRLVVCKYDLREECPLEEYRIFLERRADEEAARLLFDVGRDPASLLRAIKRYKVVGKNRVSALELFLASFKPTN
jgi:hypothetical protein